MTRLIFVDDELVLVLETDLPAAELLEPIRSGRWQPPPALAALLGPQPPPLRAVRLGRLVIVSPAGSRAARRTLSPVEVLLDPDGQPLRELSPRQAQVLQGLADGLKSKEIAEELGLNVRTIDLHIATIKRRFGTFSIMQSVLRGEALGLCKVRARPK
jgi:DNA-binding CsgD family transcriptional regulator